MKSIKIYDQLLQTNLAHLRLHPSYLPHIGLKYNEARTKTFIIAESHYLPETYNNKFSAEDWYYNPDSIYMVLTVNPKWHMHWINTRKVVKTYLESEALQKGHGIFNNLETAYKEIGSKTKLFDECVYLNYFQRPSEAEGDSIQVNEIDSKIALENLLVLNQVLKPNKLIFVSKVAYDDYLNHVSKKQKEQFPYVDYVPHPSASSWWNRKTGKYGIKGKSATGKEKFQRIMTPKN